MRVGIHAMTRFGLTAALVGPVFVGREAARLAGAAAPVTAEIRERAGRVLGDAAVAGRVLRNAGMSEPVTWRAGTRLHLALRPPGADAIRALVAEVHEHDEVDSVHWDGGLGSLVVRLAEDAAADELAGWVAEVAERHGFAVADDSAHPGDASTVRTQVVALAMDGMGLAVAVGTSLLPIERAPAWLRAAVSAAREHPAVRELMNDSFGWHTAELARAGAHAVARGFGQDPTQLLLDLALRTGQLTEAIARVAAFDRAHDELCAPDRASLGVSPDAGRERVPVENYAGGAVAGGLLGALADLLLRRDLAEAAETVLAASPLPARHTHTAFHSGVGALLARDDVLVRDPDRLRSLDRVDTVVLHASALWRDGELDPHAEAVLDAARQAELRVVLTGNLPEDAEFIALADEAVRGDCCADVVTRLRADDRVVLTVARPGPDDGPHADTVCGLLAGDVCVALTDGQAPVLWGADLLARRGLAGAWRVLLVAGAAHTVSRRATGLSLASAVLSGISLLAHGRARRRTALPWLPSLDAVAAGGLAGLSLGWGSAARAALVAPPPGRVRTAWHELTADQVAARFSTVSAEQPGALAVVRDRMWSAVAKHPVAGLATDVAGELNDPLTPVLALGAAASAVIGSPVDALLVAAAMGLNAVVGGSQQFRGRRALDQLRTEERQRARRVSADGEQTALVDARELVPGTVIELRVGDVVPADARLTEQTDLELDESALTGESLPVAKQLEPTPGAAVGDRACLVFAGTTVVSGTARAIVVATGDQTVSGRAVSLAARAPGAVGIQARLSELTNRALPLTMLGGALVTVLGAVRGGSIRRALAGGVSIAVAAVPEGLPLVATVAQLAAARRLAEYGILVRAPRALEALGRLDVMCFDKTGTLTQNRLRVVTVTAADGQPAEPGDEAVAPVLRAAARAYPSAEHTGPPAHATDQAVVDAAGPDPQWTELAGQPFEASRGYSATVGRDDETGRTVLVVKGAPETILPACAAADATAGERLADDGYRVIAVAARELPDGQPRPEFGNGDEQVLSGLDFLGFVGMADTPRETARLLVEGLRAAGIAPLMLTGDHPRTARAIATSLGWPDDTTVLAGDELSEMDKSARVRALAEAGVIARVAPEQKLQVVEALRAAGQVTAMVGDGANDAAAIRAADVGVGVRARSSTAARTAADIALTEDDLTVLLEAVAEGRALWRSVSDAVVILVGGNAGEIGFSVLGTLLSGGSPLGTRQMLLVNLMTDLFPAMAVAVTRPDDESGAETGDQPGGLGEGLNRRIASRGLTTGLGATTSWLFGRFTPGTARRTSTMALCGLVGAQLAQTLRGRWRSPLVVGTAVGSAAALAAVVQTPGLSQFFGSTPLGPLAWTGVGSGIGVAGLASLLPDQLADRP